MINNVGNVFFHVFAHFKAYFAWSAFPKWCRSKQWV